MSEDPGLGALDGEHPLEVAEGIASRLVFELVQLKTRGQLTDEAVSRAREAATKAAAEWPSALESFEWSVGRLLRSRPAEDALDDAPPAG